MTVGRVNRVATPFLPWLKDDKVVGVADEHTPEEIRGQQSIELAGAGILPGVREREEGYAGEFECSNLHILRWQG